MKRTIAKQLHRGLRARRLFVPPGHYYSPSTSAVDRKRQIAWDRASELPGLDLQSSAQCELSTQLAVHASAFTARRWHDGLSNDMFERSDATVLFAFLGHLRPQRIVEVGSGFSTAVMLDAADALGTTRDISCIEPYPRRLRSLLLPDDDVEVMEAPVQDVDIEQFTSLTPGSLLFIDSTHVAKAGSDVLYLLFQVLPRLSPGVFVHVHDIFWPFSYRADWLEEGRDWTEAYMLRAFLIGNQDWRIVLFNSWLWDAYPQFADGICSGKGYMPGSLYLQRAGG